MDQKTSQRPDLSETFSQARKERARAWFAELQGLICASLEAVEDAAEGLPGCEDKPTGRFVKTPWTRKDHSGADGGGGVMALMSGRVFEKSAAMPRPSMAPSRRNLPSRSRAPTKTRASGRAASLSSPIP